MLHPSLLLPLWGSLRPGMKLLTLQAEKSWEEQSEVDTSFAHWVPPSKCSTSFTPLLALQSVHLPTSDCHPELAPHEAVMGSQQPDSLLLPRGPQVQALVGWEKRGAEPSRSK